MCKVFSQALSKQVCFSTDHVAKMIGFWMKDALRYAIKCWTCAWVKLPEHRAVLRPEETPWKAVCSSSFCWHICLYKAKCSMTTFRQMQGGKTPWLHWNSSNDNHKTSSSLDATFWGTISSNDKRFPLLQKFAPFQWGFVSSGYVKKKTPVSAHGGSKFHVQYAQQSDPVRVVHGRFTWLENDQFINR